MNLEILIQLPAEFREKIKQELESDERMEWIGQPNPSRYRWQALPIMIFGLFWTGFSVFWVCGALYGVLSSSHSKVAFLFPLFGLPFVLIGIGMLLAPVWLCRQAKKTVYLLTDRRAVIIRGGRSFSAESFTWDRVRNREFRESSNGSGDIIFERRIISKSSRGQSSQMEVGFLGIDRVREVETLLKTLTS